MEKSEEIECQNNDNDVEEENNNISNNVDLSNSDPIPSLLLPKKKVKKTQSPISDIISSLQNINLNLNQIQIIAKNKITVFLLNQNLQKHNSTPEQKNIMLVNDLIQSKETHFIAAFKDYLISDYHEEFLRRFFNTEEIIEVLPKFYQYYKNYLNFFCKGTFSDFDVNEIMQEYGECQAEFYYNKNYGHKDRMKKRDKKEKIDEKHPENNGSNKNENIGNLDLLKVVFTKSIEYSIERIKNSCILSKEEKQELSNIKPFKNSKENTLILPDNSTISSNDIITKENSIRKMINLMHKKKQRINLNKKLKSKKKEVFKDNKNDKNKKINNNGYINKYFLNKKLSYSLSKTSSNLNIKNYIKNKNIKSKSRNKTNRVKPNYFTNNNYKSKNAPSISNYKKYIDILCFKHKNKSNEPKTRIFQDDIGLSSQKTIKNNRTKNIISSFNSNDLFNHLNLFSNNNYNSNICGNKNNNKVNSSLLIFNHLLNNDKNNKNISNYNTLFPLSLPKNKIIKYRNKKIENKDRRKSKNKIKEKDLNKYLNFNHNIKSFFKSIKNFSCTPKTIYSNNNSNYNSNYNSNKSLSYSTVNNCNININNNIILSNNYFNNKNHHLNQQINFSSRKIITPTLHHRKFNIQNSIFKSAASRNNQNDLNRLKTDSNMLNSIGNHDIIKKKVSKKRVSINPYKSFRKSYNNEILMKNKNLEKKKKKYYNSNRHRNLSLKNIPITVKNNLNYNFHHNNKTGKLFDEYELNSNNKTYKNLCLKKNNNNSHQKKIIFDYQRK